MSKCFSDVSDCGQHVQNKQNVCLLLLPSQKGGNIMNVTT